MVAAARHTGSCRRRPVVPPERHKNRQVDVFADQVLRPKALAGRVVLIAEGPASDLIRFAPDCHTQLLSPDVAIETSDGGVRA
jgi:hypothetical protein